MRAASVQTRPSRGRQIRERLSLMIVPALLLAALAGLLAVQARSLPVFPHHAPAPPPVQSAPKQIVLGVTTTPLARNWWRQWRLRDLESVNRFERDVGAHAQIVMWYADWEHDALTLSQLNAVARHGSVPEITWEPWDAGKGLYARQPRYRLREIINGSFDPYIRNWARTLAAWNRPVLLRFAQELDGNWYPWDEHANGNRAGEFVRAWRHVHDIFTREGATHVKWVWSPAFAIRAQQFPGTDYVDMLGVTCLNSGTTQRGGKWRSFARICARPIRELHALAPTLPIQLSETGTSAAGGSKAAWIAGLFAFLRGHPEVHSLVWFNVRMAPDWVITSSRAAQQEFAAGLRPSSVGLAPLRPARRSAEP